MALLVGLLAGTFGGFVGLGGGAITIPFMVDILKLDQHKAHGTNLVTIVFTGLAGAVMYGLEGNIDLAAACFLAAPAIFTTRAGCYFAHSLPEWKLKRSFGYFIVFVSLLLLAKPYLPGIQGMERGWAAAAVLVVTGVILGFLSGMLGVGGGIIMVPAMVLLTGFTQHTAQGTSLLAMVPIGSVGAYTHWKLGNVKTSILPGMISGILVGACIGGTLAHHFSEGGLRIAFAAVLIWTGARYMRAKAPLDAEDSATCLP
ncbi:MAG TPA: sulfite exporter TauE/SafE family protein [Syntrophales bacterium]|nr:sulfite exporter TauE/SafE family protein [Syntrophales bacterium]